MSIMDSYQLISDNNRAKKAFSDLTLRKAAPARTMTSGRWRLGWDGGTSLDFCCLIALSFTESGLDDVGDSS